MDQRVVGQPHQLDGVDQESFVSRQTEKLEEASGAGVQLPPVETIEDAMTALAQAIGGEMLDFRDARLLRLQKDMRRRGRKKKARTSAQLRNGETGASSTEEGEVEELLAEGFEVIPMKWLDLDKNEQLRVEGGPEVQEKLKSGIVICGDLERGEPGEVRVDCPTATVTAINLLLSSLLPNPQRRHFRRAFSGSSDTTEDTTQIFKGFPRRFSGRKSFMNHEGKAHLAKERHREEGRSSRESEEEGRKDESFIYNPESHTHGDLG